MSIESGFAFGPQEIFGDKGLVFFLALVQYVNQNKDEIVANDSQETAFIHLPENLYRAWRALQRSERKILDSLIRDFAQKAFWRTASLSEAHGIKSTLQLIFYL